MRKNVGFVGKALVIVAAITALLIVGFLLTKQAWYDISLSVPERVSFWNEALVAYGTLALAAVTVASVWETQQVLKGEDRRFRQSRMPMVRILTLRSENPTDMELEVVNTGGGPALEVRLNAVVRYQISGKNPINENEAVEKFRRFHIEDTIVSSYLEKRGTAWTKIVPDDRDEVHVLYFQTYYAVETATIEYHDAFGYEYRTQYLTNEEFPYSPTRFNWFPPPELTEVE